MIERMSEEQIRDSHYKANTPFKKRVHFLKMFEQAFWFGDRVTGKPLTKEDAKRRLTHEHEQYIYIEEELTLKQGEEISSRLTKLETLYHITFNEKFKRGY